MVWHDEQDEMDFDMRVELKLLSLDAFFAHAFALIGWILMYVPKLTRMSDTARCIHPNTPGNNTKSGKLSCHICLLNNLGFHNISSYTR